MESIVPPGAPSNWQSEVVWDPEIGQWRLPTANDRSELYHWEHFNDADMRRLADEMERRNRLHDPIQEPPPAEETQPFVDRPSVADLADAAGGAADSLTAEQKIALALAAAAAAAAAGLAAGGEVPTASGAPPPPTGTVPDTHDPWDPVSPTPTVPPPFKPVPPPPPKLVMDPARYVDHLFLSLSSKTRKRKNSKNKNFL
uniref:Uncharacterized protein n=1 Tax=Riboviria sp. TaxID=2585031 RepID=A0A514DBZ5_9VIRU|nr:MAG: hypothetical protein H4Rhizo441558_000004 [Riboviria sp.]